MSNNNTNNSTTIDEERMGKPYMGHTKLVDEHGQKVVVPDLEPLSSPFVPTPVNKSNDNTTDLFGNSVKQDRGVINRTVKTQVKL
jgi:hypothetical protein